MSYTAYLARPVDFNTRGMETRKICNRMVSDLINHGYRVYQPSEAWSVGSGAAPHPVLQSVNNYALGSADLVVAYLPQGVATVGVPMEIERACLLGIPVIVVTEWEGSYALARPEITMIDGVLEGQLADTLIELEQHVHARSSAHREANNEIRLVVRAGHNLPGRTYPDDAGLDLTTVQEYTIDPGRFVDVHTQVDQTQLPDGYWGMITGRSSALRRWGLFVPTGVIDPGWRGPLFIGVWNLGQDPVTVAPGVRLGQLILIPNNPAEVLAVTDVADALRGVQGFGSSG